VGEAANFILIPMFIAALEQVLEWGVSNVQAYCRELTRDLIRGASSGEAEGRGVEPVGHLFGLPIPEEVDPAGLDARLRARSVFVSVRGRIVRVSPHVYNDRADLEALRRVLTKSGVLTAPARGEAAPR
jgi:selenocysteine lyase/cysteine desulfurase